MKLSSLSMAIIFFFILLPNRIQGREIDLKYSASHAAVAALEGKAGRRQGTLQVAGSSLPDCSHACGSCLPCRLVVVSFICEEEAETCPMAYKCMCKSKSYPVP